MTDTQAGSGETHVAKRYVITCMRPDCKNPIHYYTDDAEVPLYCGKHRTYGGRHSQTRKLR